MAEAKKAAPAKAKAAPKQEPKTDWVIKDRVYELKGGPYGPVYKIASRHSEKRPLMYFDPAFGYERELRYATNQKSVFVDEQEGHVTLEHIMFRDGSLFVPKNKIALQKLLSIYHPLKDVRFYEVDTEREAVDDLDQLNIQLEAQILSNELDIDHLEAIMRVEEGSKVSTMTSKEIKRDARLFAIRNPKLFIELAKDENVALRNFGIRAVEQGYIELSQDQRHFKWKSNGRKLFTIPFDENPYSALASWFKTDEGVDVYNNLEKKLK